jgi:hypothetical protein
MSPARVKRMSPEAAGALCLLALLAGRMPAEGTSPGTARRCAARGTAG